MSLLQMYLVFAAIGILFGGIAISFFEREDFKTYHQVLATLVSLVPGCNIIFVTGILIVMAFMLGTLLHDSKLGQTVLYRYRK